MRIFMPGTRLMLKKCRMHWIYFYEHGEIVLVLGVQGL